MKLQQGALSAIDIIETARTQGPQTAVLQLITIPDDDEMTGTLIQILAMLSCLVELHFECNPNALEDIRKYLLNAQPFTKFEGTEN